ncbi:ribosomal protein L15 [Periconia macrospinosa]|uniref:Ribosomal protein L15 n=1 Tax=Periconia macrospinosa TaxID=97972 RepID=A0A2V1DEF8_9PLEO|nr:ribosomal protein L15 [Periconia macrospinosa]
MPPRLRALRLSSSLFCQSHVPPKAPLIKPFLLPAQQRFASILSSLSDNKGAYHKKIRRGRGPASGKGKTSGRGQKGQHAHGKVPAGFQGGQTPLSITKRVRGRNKYNPFTVEMSPINLDRIQSWIDQGRLDASKPITMRELHKSRCLHGVKRHGVKLLARNVESLTSAINIVVSRASTAAIEKIESLGGSVTTRFYSPTSIKRVLSGESHPTISIDASPELITSTCTAGVIPEPVLTQFKTAFNPKHKHRVSPATAAARQEALNVLMRQVATQYKYRLPDATSRKDIEYYRDPAHRGYLSYKLKSGESPSLYFKLPKSLGGTSGKPEKKKAATKTVTETRLF